MPRIENGPELPRLTTLLLCAFCVLFTGCSVVGPDAIRSGRLAYNEAITETNNQQMLMVFVRNRYEETNNLLAVSSVTANVSASSSAQIEAGFGDSDDYDGNLVPFRGGFVYEENPTISYTPVTGEAYIRQLMSPVPIAVFAEITQSQPWPDFAYAMLINSINGIRNPAFLYGSQEDDPRFDRVVATMTELTHRHCLHWTRNPQKPEAAYLVIERGTHCADMTAELLGLLGITDSPDRTGRVVIPVEESLDGSASGAIGLTTRSLWNLVGVLSAAVEVPAAHVQSGEAEPAPRPGRTGRQVRIRYSGSKPQQAYVEVKHRDGWFYIDSRDIETKRYFKLLSSLWSAAMAKSLVGNTSTPVLTVPVSR